MLPLTPDEYLHCVLSHNKTTLPAEALGRPSLLVAQNVVRARQLRRLVRASGFGY